MAKFLQAFDSPVETDLTCANCRQPLVALGEVRRSGGMIVAGLREYAWTHLDGRAACQPLIRYARPSDDWHATTVVQAALALDEVYEDAVEVLNGPEGEAP